MKCTIVYSNPADSQTDKKNTFNHQMRSCILKSYKYSCIIHTVRKSPIYKKKQKYDEEKGKCVCVRVLRNGYSYSSRYIRNELKPHHYHHQCPYEHKKRGSRPYYKFREILDRNHESEGGQVLVEKTRDRDEHEQKWVMLLLNRRVI